MLVITNRSSETRDSHKSLKHLLPSHVTSISANAVYASFSLGSEIRKTEKQ